MESIYNEEIKEGNVPSINDFAINFTETIRLPYTEAWKVTGASIASAFLIGGYAGKS